MLASIIITLGEAKNLDQILVEAVVHQRTNNRSPILHIQAKFFAISIKIRKLSISAKSVTPLFALNACLRSTMDMS